MANDSMRTVRLRERTTKRVRLRRADLEFLLAHHSSHLGIVPTHRRGWYTLTPREVVGVVLTSNETRFEIRPKIPLRNLLEFEDDVNSPSGEDDRVEDDSAEDVPSVLARMLLDRLEPILLAGLHRDYREREHSGPYLVGRLDVAEQVRQQSKQTTHLHCRADEFTVDVPCNRVLRTALDSLAGSVPHVERALSAFEGVMPASPESVVFDEIRAPERYRSALALCERILMATVPTLREGSREFPSYLLRMDRLFESYLTRALGTALADERDTSLDGQPRSVIVASDGDRPELAVRPDMVLSRGGRPVAVVDAKWKQLDGSLVTDDVYQMLAYCSALGIPRGVLVYSDTKNRVWEYPLAGEETVLEVRGLRVVGSSRSRARAVRRLARALTSRKR